MSTRVIFIAVAAGCVLTVVRILTFEDPFKRFLMLEDEIDPELASTFPGMMTTTAMTSADGDSNHRSQSCCSEKKNAIVYLAQKSEHSSYQRDSFSLLKQSLHLLYENYLSIDNHYNNTDLFIFHTSGVDSDGKTGDSINREDLEVLESSAPLMKGMIRLVNLKSTPYWEIPVWLRDSNMSEWAGLDEFSIGYRHMIRLFAIKIWDYFKTLNEEQGCEYEYIMRLDEDSFILSPIRYDLFDFMKRHGYWYGYRMCSYELGKGAMAWHHYMRDHPFVKVLTPWQNKCGFYNNFFIAKLSFFLSYKVQHFLQFIDRTGYIYQKRVGDLVLHTQALYSLCPPQRIHRFLDFTYQHMTMKDNCPRWGGIQQGYNDKDLQRIQDWYQKNVIDQACPVQSPNDPWSSQLQQLHLQDLSPTYAHLSGDNTTLGLYQVTAGHVEVKGKRELSG